MTRVQFRNTTANKLYGNVSRRVRGLEMRPSKGSLYIVDQLLGSEADHVDFSIPSTLTTFDLVWSSYQGSDGVVGRAIGMMFYNGDDYNSTSFDSFWNIDIANTVGGQTQVTDASFSDQGCGFSLFPGISDGSIVGAGTIRFPNYVTTYGLDTFGHYTGTGMGNGGSYTPEVWAAGGWAQSEGPLVSIRLRLFDLSDTGEATPLHFGVNSRFTLIGYPVP